MKIMTERRKKEILKLIDNLYFEFGTKNQIRFFREHTGFKTSIYEEEANFFSVQLLKDYIEYHQDEVADLEIAEEIEKFI